MHTEIDLDELLSDMQGPSTEDLSQPKPAAPVAAEPEQDLEALLADETTVSTEIPPAVAEPAPRNGLDITFSAPMSASLAFAVGDEADRARLLQAQKDAQDAIAAHTEEVIQNIDDLSVDWATAELTQGDAPAVQDVPAPAVVKPALPKVAIPKISVPKIAMPQIPRKALVIGGGALLALALAGGVARWVLNRPAAVVPPTPAVKASPAVKTVPAEATPAVKTEPASATSSPAAPGTTPPPAKPAPTEASAPAPAAAPTPVPKVEPAPKPAASAPTQAAPAPKAVPPAPAEAKPQAAPAPVAKSKPAATPKSAAKPKATPPKKGWQDKANSDMDAYLNGLKKN